MASAVLVFASIAVAAAAVAITRAPPPVVRRGIAPQGAPPFWLALIVAVAATLCIAAVANLAGSGASLPRPDGSGRPMWRDDALELIALGDERSADRLTIYGVVRNPRRGLVFDHLVAVVLLFNAQGGFLTSGRAALEGGMLGPGRQSTFAVTVPEADAVGHYRVSFRDDARIVPHIDRRPG
jgi:hypothetical protein